MGRTAPGEVEVSFINIDTPASEQVLAELCALPNILECGR